MPAPTFKPGPFPPLDTAYPPHPYEAVHQWLCNVYGCHPQQMVATDPAQNFSPVVDLEPLMLLLGGPWTACVKRCRDAKESTDDKRANPGTVQTGDEKDGSFLAGAAARGAAMRGAAPTPPPGDNGLIGMLGHL